MKITITYSFENIGAPAYWAKSVIDGEKFAECSTRSYDEARGRLMSVMRKWLEHPAYREPEQVDL